jgi:hypothetical protein
LTAPTGMARDAPIRDRLPDDVSAVRPGAALGLYAASDFRLADGHCSDCPTLPQRCGISSTR